MSILPAASKLKVTLEFPGLVGVANCHRLALAPPKIAIGSDAQQTEFDRYLKASPFPTAVEIGGAALPPLSC